MRMIKLGRILSLLILSFIILTSMSECKQGDVPLVEYTKYSPVNADINGVSFTSGDYTYLAWGDTCLKNGSSIVANCLFNNGK